MVTVAPIARLISACWLLFFTIQTWAALSVQDDTGARISLVAPAQRMVSLAPHVTEMLFSAGAGERIVATVEFSDYPAKARNIPRLGSASSLDMEALVALSPDLVVAWKSGIAAHQLEQIKSMGMKIYISEPKELGDIARTISNFGVLAGTETIANKVADDFVRYLEDLGRQHQGRSKVRLFYQIWGEPLMTVNGEHYISQVLELCGGVNVFAELSAQAPQVDVESVLKANPAGILISSTNESDRSQLALWENWVELEAVREGHVYPVPWDLISRYSIRIADAAKIVCRQIESIRD